MFGIKDNLSQLRREQIRVAINTILLGSAIAIFVADIVLYTRYGILPRSLVVANLVFLGFIAALKTLQSIGDIRTLHSLMPKKMAPLVDKSE
jgi:hypothetical protein